MGAVVQAVSTWEESQSRAKMTWSKPHVSTPGLAGLLQLRRLLKTGITSLHLAAADYPAICRAVSETLVAEGVADEVTGFLSQGVRGFLADFAVIIGILVMTGVDFAFQLPTPKLAVPAEFKPTSDDRGWLVLDDKLFSNPMWVDGILAPLFALLASILLFMDQQITAVIVNNKDYKLKKGCGYHLDLLVLAVVILISSFFGLPFVANTIP